MSRNSAVRILLVLFLMAAFAGVGVAQVITGTILGNVTDDTKAPLPGVTITLKNLDKGDTRTMLTDPAGNYRAPGLSLGRYEIRAELSGFQPVVRTGITVNVGSESTLNFSLKVAQIAEAIVVQAEAPAVNTTESQVSYLVDEKKIQNLPLNGRDYAQLILLQPGVIMSRASVAGSDVGYGVKISVAGSRPNQNLFTLDGTDYNDALNNTPASAQGYMTGVETIKEFQVLTNTMSAEYGRASGGVFNVVTKSGTNEFHGSAFEFHRDDSLDSKNFFSQENPKFRRNQFGASIGGPLAKDRLFFFGSYEGLREIKDLPSVATVLDDDARNGILATSTVKINPLITPYLNLFPHGNGRVILDANGKRTGAQEYRSTFNRNSVQNFGVLRFDENFTDRDTAFARILIDNSNIDQPVFYAEWPNLVRNRKVVGTIEERHMFSSSLLNELRVGYNKSRPLEDVNPLNPHTDIAFVQGKSFGSVNVTGLTEIGTDRTNPKLFAATEYQATDTFSFITARNAIKTGVNFAHFRYDGNSESRSRGRLNFRNFSDFLTGKPRTFEIAKPGSDFQRDYRQNLIGTFVQDDITVTPSLTVNAGVRWEFVTTPTEANGKVSNLRDPMDKAVTVGGDLFKNHTTRNVAPRLGFAWQITRDGRTALRGGYGLFYDQPLFSTWRNPIFRALPYVDRATISNPTLPIDPTKVATTGVSDSEAFVYDLNPVYTEHWNLNIQRDLGFFNTSVLIGYFGSRGRNLLGQGDVNIAIPQIQPDGTEFFPSGSARRNPNFGVIRMIMQGFASKYNGVHVGLQQRRSHGFQYQISYAYGKSEDNRSGSGGRQEYENGQARTFDPYNKSLDWGPSDFDVRHNLIANASYDLPLGKGRLREGWQISTIATYASGIPFSPVLAGDPDRDGSSDNIGRPNLIPGCNPNNVSGGRNSDHWFNAACYSFPAPGTRGNAKRNSLRGPDFRTVDMAFVKSTPVVGGYSAQIRFEIFNVFNRANFDLPSNTTDGETIFDETGARLADAGKIFATVGDARSFQLAFRLLF
ncbi:MAG TPA: carboxypeptidase regulatory-like domain-containing protein [Thermoanaerobaculia bacterium]